MKSPVLVAFSFLVAASTGILMIASKNVYFWSPQKAVKFPVKKMLAVLPLSDGIEVMRDARMLLPQFFKIDDPLFACGAIARLHHI